MEELLDQQTADRVRVAGGGGRGWRWRRREGWDIGKRGRRRMQKQSNHHPREQRHIHTVSILCSFLTIQYSFIVYVYIADYVHALCS